MPVTVPQDDPFYSPQRVRCMTYIRSLHAFRPDCSFGPAEQVRGIDSRLDSPLFLFFTFNARRRWLAEAISCSTLVGRGRGDLDADWSVPQMNQATHFLDGSQLYGTSTHRERSLRKYANGQLLLRRKPGHRGEYLPPAEAPRDRCQVASDQDVCYKSGK